MYGTWQSTPNKALTFLTCVMLIMPKKNLSLSIIVTVWENGSF